LGGNPDAVGGDFFPDFQLLEQRARRLVVIGTDFALGTHFDARTGRGADLDLSVLAHHFQRAGRRQRIGPGPDVFSRPFGDADVANAVFVDLDVTGPAQQRHGKHDGQDAHRENPVILYAARARLVLEDCSS
jgi:hypothetical protein